MLILYTFFIRFEIKKFENRMYNTYDYLFLIFLIYFFKIYIKHKIIYAR